MPRFFVECWADKSPTCIKDVGDAEQNNKKQANRGNVHYKLQRKVMFDIQQTDIKPLYLKSRKKECIDLLSKSDVMKSEERLRIIESNMGYNKSWKERQA